MADLSDNKWNEQDNLNTSPAPDGMPTGSLPTTLYGIERAARGAIKRSWKRINAILTSTGTGAAYVLTYDVGPTGFVKGERFAFFPHADNTGAATIKINGLTTKPLVQASGAALVAGQIKAGQSITVEYDGTSYRVLSPVTNNPVFTGSISADVVNATTVSATNLSGNGSAVTDVNAAKLGGSDLATITSNTQTALNAKANIADTYNKADVDALFNGAAPIGAIMAFARSTPPPRWVVADGSQLSRSVYSALFAVIGTTFGAGDGSTTFNLPDLRAEFIRGWDSGRGIDSGRAFGSAQAHLLDSHTHTGTADSAGAHTHTFVVGQNPTGSTNSFDTDAASQGDVVATKTTSSAGAHTHTLSINATGGTETRPRNVALLYCIRIH